MKNNVITICCAIALFPTVFVAPVFANITGSTLTATTKYTSGETNTLVYRCDAVTPDYEYIYTVVVNYLTGMNVVTGYNAVGQVNGGQFSYNGAVGDAAIARWDSDENLGAGYGSLVNGESGYFTNEVVVSPSITGDVVLVYYLFGDGYGVEPHGVTNTLILEEFVDSMLSVLGTNGAVVASGESVSAAKGTDFGLIFSGTALTNTFSITNSGTDALAISGWVTNGTGASTFEISDIPSQVSAGTMSNFYITFAPSVVGIRTAVLEIANNSAVSPYVVNLQGDASSGPGGIGLSTSSLSYATTYGATPADQTFTIANVGGMAFTYTNNMTYNEGAIEWFTPAPLDGTMATNSSQITTGSVSVVGLNAGIYHATNAVTSPTATNSPQLLGVTLTINKADQTINFSDPGAQETTNKVGLAATATSGLTVGFNVDSGPGSLSGGTNLSFTADGNVVVTASQAGDTNWNTAPSVTHTIAVTRATAQVTLYDLAQTYNGTARVVTNQTSPTGLTVDLTYEGLAWAPTNAGNYTVTGLVNDAMYQGSETATLVVGLAGQTISFPAIPDQETTNKVGLAATATSGLEVTFAVSAGPASIAGGTNLSFTGAGSVSIVASQAGDANWNAAPDVINTFRVQIMGNSRLSTDYNGDHISDLAVYDAVLPAWYIRRIDNMGAPPIAFGLGWGGSTLEAVAGDYNGDFVCDPAVYDSTSGEWFIRDLRPGMPPICYAMNWGGPDIVPVPGDYSGNGLFDLAVYETTSGKWFVRTLGDTNPPILFGMQWGGATMTPVPGDYNGDGLFDLACYQEATGNWYIRRIDDTNVPPICFGQNWGGPGLIPVSGDYNGDGVSDLAVYEINTGLWYIRSLGTPDDPPIVFGQQWGGNGTIPVAGDYNGDGIFDLAVYGLATGDWFIRRLGSDQGSVIAYGLNWGDANTDAVGASE